MKHPVGINDSYLKAANDTAREMELQMTGSLTALIENNGEMSDGNIQILLSIRDTMIEASSYRTFPTIDMRHFNDMLHSMVFPPGQYFSLRILELSRELSRKGILDEGANLAKLGDSVLKGTRTSLSPTVLISMMDNFFWLGLYHAREKWFLRALNIYRTHKKELTKSVYQGEILEKFQRWSPISHMSGWNESKHRLEFEIMMIKFSLGDI
ncbi:MAG: hypothetical protein QGH39_12570 [Candidatus Thermoplasmatota archaeon]|jgi:hypothetical protein|nr:hypothetical protein [Candidatus Thermoplasmatota archaeon]MDP7266380.1 hypothetical protein [Candidatus Thermoplasmatota archaeon]